MSAFQCLQRRFPRNRVQVFSSPWAICRCVAANMTVIKMQSPTQAISPWGALGKTTSVTAPIKAGGKVRVKALPSQIPKQNLSRLPLQEAYLGVLLVSPPPPPLGRDSSPSRGYPPAVCRRWRRLWPSV